MKKSAVVLWGALLCALLYATAYAEGSPLDTALRNSCWSAYTPVREVQAETVCAGVAVDASTGRAVFAIARKENDAFALAACYECLIPQDVDPNVILAEAHDAGDSGYNVPCAIFILQKREDGTMQYVRFLCDADDGWYPEMLVGEYEGERYSVICRKNEETLILNRHGLDTNTLVPMDAIDLSQQGFSFTQTLKTAGEAIDRNELAREETALEMLREAFPDEDFPDGEMLDYDLWNTKEDCAVSAVVRWHNRSMLYLVDRFGQARAAIAGNMVPIYAKADSICVDQRYENGEERELIVCVGYTCANTHYSVTITRDADGDFDVASMDFQEGDCGYWNVDFHDGTMEIRPGYGPRGGNLRRETPLSLRALSTFDPTYAANEAKAAFRAYKTGEAPYIPASEDAYALPQPCGATLKQGVYDVYTGPGKQYYRESGGKACVSTKDWIQVFGRVDDWVLIQYRVDGSLLRFGYVYKSALADIDQVPRLHFEAKSVRQDNQFVTSNPLGEGGDIALTGGETASTRLCTLGDFWMYVELTLPNGEPARMFTEIRPSHG